MRQDRTPATCTTCKRSFVPLRQSAGKFCSNACVSVTASLSQVYACSHCGTPILRRPSQVRPRMYCSRVCQGAARKIEVICIGCSASFAVPAYRQKMARFCSTACHYETTRRRPIRERFEARVIKTGDCWTLDVVNYGQMRVYGKKLSMHHIAWELASGSPVPEGFIILHTCDQRDCVRNDEPGVYIVRGAMLPRFGHLALGTFEQNSQDMADKGRDRWSLAREDSPQLAR